ncbi:hypothetical protein [Nitrospira sp. Kam-Ns4a]
MKPIRLSAHAQQYTERRGFTVVEVEQTIRNSTWKAAMASRLECAKDFPFNREWNGVVYATKRVRPIFVEEEQEIVVITVYTYYF